MKKVFFGLVALVGAIAAFAFTPKTERINDGETQLIWFDIDTDEQVIDRNDGSELMPSECTNATLVPCASAFEYPTEVDLVGGSYQLKPGVSDISDRDDYRTKQ